MRMSIVYAGICATLLSSCAGLWSPASDGDDARNPARREAAAEARAISPRGGHAGDGGRSYSRLASLRPDLPTTFTGCLEEDEICFVVGEPVDAVMRYEPQSARYWFLDPTSGNTYYADGELRTGDLFRQRQALELAAQREAEPQEELRIDTFPLIPDDAVLDVDDDEEDDSEEEDDEDNGDDDAKGSVGAATSGASL